ncbi:MAG: hypothetical protein QOF12_1188 [Solirubrobacteraceae bacterium]|jgi:hypothetical protein|nr:hypothetical protein [Solirubrobacteraceae bacterium]
MPPKPRQIKIEQRSALAAMQALETKSDDELLKETRFKSAAQAILGARAAERYDAKAARAYFQQAIAAARPQERMQLRRMADASLAMAERRPDDLKAAMEKLGQTPPSGRQLLVLRLLALVNPPPGSGPLLRARGILLIIVLVVALLAIGFGIVFGIGQAAGGIGVGAALPLGALLIIAILGVLAFFGRRRQAAAVTRARAGGPGGG